MLDHYTTVSVRHIEGQVCLEDYPANVHIYVYIYKLEQYREKKEKKIRGG